jgi:DNA-binding NarL/FixJ family response regulator
MILTVSDRAGKEQPQPVTQGPGADPAKLRRILLVEDDYIAAADAEATLLDAGFEVIGPASSAEQAIELARAELPELVIMDIRLTGPRDGIDAAREILRSTGIRSVFATAHSTSEARRRAEESAPLGWLPKPYTQHALIEAVRVALVKLDR